MSNKPGTGEGEGNSSGKGDGNKPKVETDTTINTNTTTNNTIKIVNALTSCFNKKLEVSKNIYFFVVLFLLYLIVFYSANEINKIKECESETIKRIDYQQLISGYVYWIISFILIVILKKNNVNIINNLVWELKGGKEVGIGSDLDKATIKQLEQGKRLIEILKQGQYKPQRISLQIAIVYAAITEQLNNIPLDKTLEFEKELHSILNMQYSELLTEIETTKKLTDSIKEKLNKIIKDCSKLFIHES